MMREIRCERCGRLVPLQGPPGEKQRCPECRGPIKIPAALAALPRPQVPLAVEADHAAPPRSTHQADPQHEPAVARLLPWVVSALFHVGVVLLMAFAVLLEIQQPRGGTDRPVEPQIAPPPATPMALEVPLPERSVARQEDDMPDRVDRQRKATDRRTDQEEMPHSVQRKVADIIGKGIPAGDPSGGPVYHGMKIGVPGGGGQKSIAGAGRNYIFVIDRSGSMVEDFDLLRQELYRALSYLHNNEGDTRVVAGRMRNQYFHVIFFADGLQELPRRRLIPATVANKVAAYDFLESLPSASGQTNPMEALSRAFAVARRADGPVSICFLTDAEFPDEQAVLKLVREQTKGRPIGVYTYHYGDRNPEAEALMKKIADMTGCSYRHIDGN